MRPFRVAEPPRGCRLDALSAFYAYFFRIEVSKWVRHALTSLPHASRFLAFVSVVGAKLAAPHASIPTGGTFLFRYAVDTRKLVLFCHPSPTAAEYVLPI